MLIPGNPAMSQPRTGSVSNVGGYTFPAGSQGYTKGGYGAFSQGKPPQYSTTRCKDLNPKVNDAIELTIETFF